MTDQVFKDIDKLPKTAVMEARVDMRSLASVTRYLISRGYNVSTKSSLIRTALEMFTIVLRNNRLEEGFISTADALNYMNSVGLDFGKIGQKGNKSLAIEMQKETLVADFDVPKGKEDIVQKTKDELLGITHE